jgi:hypothetical protein
VPPALPPPAPAPAAALAATPAAPNPTDAAVQATAKVGS